MYQIEFMKTILTALAISFCLFSCQKDEKTKPDQKVEYKISCQECSVEIGADPSVKAFAVKDFLIYHTVANEPTTIIIVSGSGEMKTQVNLNRKVIFNQTDSNGRFVYTVKLK